MRDPWRRMPSGAMSRGLRKRESPSLSKRKYYNSGFPSSRKRSHNPTLAARGSGIRLGVTRSSDEIIPLEAIFAFAELEISWIIPFNDVL
jgi:hypothetical protein